MTELAMERKHENEKLVRLMSAQNLRKRSTSNSAKMISKSVSHSRLASKTLNHDSKHTR